MSFINVPSSDFSIREVRDQLEQALSDLELELPITASPIISGYEVPGMESYLRYDPSLSKDLVAKINFAGFQELETALQVADAFQKTWSAYNPKLRIEYTRKLAQIMLERRFELCSVIIREAGKPWKEADADVVEAIDFCNYYAAEYEKISASKLTIGVLGEENYYSYRARGVAAVISPWNFPLAIACGMCVASLITGNVVIFKPAEQTSLTAYFFSQMVHEAGFPVESFCYLPARGEVVGSKLVRDKRVHLICFTGSKAVGLDIISATATLQADQKHIKRVIAELGGKNPIIVDDDADLDEAIKGILYSAFGYAGQKCSACSRVIVHQDCYQILLKRLAAACKDLIVGQARYSESYIGPLIDLESQTRVIRQIEAFKNQHSLLVETGLSRDGYYVPGTVFFDVDTNSQLWNEEIFAPVLAITKATDFKHAIEIANNNQYALTAAVYSRSPHNINYAKQNLEAGNLYINRACTGAIVGRQPFGGYKLSGIGSKAGGPDYLLQFVEPRLISENTMRRGFTPQK